MTFLSQSATTTDNIFTIFPYLKNINLIIRLVYLRSRFHQASDTKPAAITGTTPTKSSVFQIWAQMPQIPLFLAKPTHSDSKSLFWIVSLLWKI